MATQEPLMKEPTTYGAAGSDGGTHIVMVGDTKPDEQDNYDANEDSAQIVVVKWENYKASIPVNHRTFMRKVLYTLCMQLLITTAVIAMCIYVESIRKWLVEHYWMYIVGIVGNVCILCHLMLVKDAYPSNIIWLIIWTVVMSYTLGTLCAAYATVFGGDMIMQALGITILVFLILALFSMQTKCNLYPLGLLAFMICNVMFWWGMWALIFGWYNTSAWSLMFILVFSLLIMFDIWRMTNMPVFDENAWIPAAINLYLDIINLFLYILSFMASRR